MKLKVKYEIVEKEGDKPQKKSTEIFLSGALMPEDITQMLIDKNPGCESIEIKKVEEVKPKAPKVAVPKDKDEKDKDEKKEGDEPEGITVKMEFTIFDDSCIAKVEADGEMVIDGNCDYEDHQVPTMVGGLFIGAVNEVLEELSGEDEDDEED